MRLYQTHWWRCTGPCHKRRPHFGIVRRSANRAPGPRDYWWDDHKRVCGGSFIKIKEPEKKGRKTTKSTETPNDITKYITTTINNKITISVLKDSNIPVKTNFNATLIIGKKEPLFNPQYKKPPVLFEGNGKTLGGGKPKRKPNSYYIVDGVRNVWSKKQSDVTTTPDKKEQVTITPVKKEQVAETVRNVWTKKQLPVALTLNKNKERNEETNCVYKNSVCITHVNVHKANCIMKSPPAKVKKINDYFKATSVLKDLYGGNINITKTSDDNQKFIAVSTKLNSSVTVNNEADDKNAEDIIEFVDCPICNELVNSQEINRHLDECLNKEVIENICNETREGSGDQASTSAGKRKKPFNIKEEFGDSLLIPVFQPKKGMYDAIQSIKPENTLHSVEDTTSLDDAENELQKPFKVEPGTSRANGSQALISAGQSNIPFNIKIGEKAGVMPSTPVSQTKKELYDGIHDIKPEIISLDDVESELQKPFIDVEPSTSTDNKIITKCACCGETMDKPLEQHLDECLTFFGNNTTIPEEGASTSSAIETIVIDDDDDIFDESSTLNATGTKVPCPCCLEMVEEAEMNEHLDMCLS